MSEVVNLGKVSMTAEGNYDPLRSYDKLAVVAYNGLSWVSRKKVPVGVAPSGATSAFWQKISERGERGPQGQSYVDKELVPIVDDLTTGGSANVLSAEQGKVLKQELTELESNFENKKQVDLTLSQANKYIDANGVVLDSTIGLNIYAPIPFQKGDVIYIPANGSYQEVACLSIIESNVYKPLFIIESGSFDTIYKVETDMDITICVKSTEKVYVYNAAIPDSNIFLLEEIGGESRLNMLLPKIVSEIADNKSEIAKVLKLTDVLTTTISYANTYITPEGESSSSSLGLNIYDSVNLKRGQKVLIVHDKTYSNVATISKLLDGQYIPLVVNATRENSQYTASEDITIVICKKETEKAYITKGSITSEDVLHDKEGVWTRLSDIILEFVSEIADNKSEIAKVASISQLSVGNPIYLSSEIEDEILTSKVTTDVYNIYDNLCEAYPHLIKRESNIGINSSNQEIRHYTICLQDAVLNQNETGVTPNMWTSENDLKHIIINAGWHGNEKSSVYGVALLVKELVESNSEWAVFVKSNVKIDVIPIANPWGFDNNQRNNQEDVNCGFDFVNFTTSEARAVRDFVLSIKDNTIAVIDSHNNPSSGCKSCFWEQRPTDFSFMAQTRLSAQIATIVRDSWSKFLVADRKPYLHMVSGEWAVSYTTFSWWFVQQGLWGITIEAPCNVSGGAENHLKTSQLTKDMIGNMLVAYSNL